MAVLTIRVVPDPILRKRAREIRVIDASIRKLARDMVETMQEARGVGLAANQVGVLKRLIVLQMPEEDPRVMINPEITHREGERQVDEGCLSVPGYVGLVTRSVKVKARALDEAGAKFRLTAELLLAQAIEHEVDHLNGILYLDHLVAHEQLRKVEQPVSEGAGGQPLPSPVASHQAVDPSTPHLHDVEYRVHIDHGGDGRAGREEVVAAHARLSGLTSDVSKGDLVFDLVAAKSPKEPSGAPRARKRVRSADPALDGGVILDSPTKARSTGRQDTGR